MSADALFDDNDAASVVRVAPLTDRVNGEPPILKGLSSSEVQYAGACFFPLWFVFGGLLALLFRHWQILMLLSVLGPMLSVYACAGYFAKLKRNRPDHYYRHVFIRWLHRLGLWGSPFVSRCGAWDLGRSLPAFNATGQATRQGWRKLLGWS